MGLVTHNSCSISMCFTCLLSKYKAHFTAPFLQSMAEMWKEWGIFDSQDFGWNHFDFSIRSVLGHKPTPVFSPLVLLSWILLSEVENWIVLSPCAPCSWCKPLKPMGYKLWICRSHPGHSWMYLGVQIMKNFVVFQGSTLGKSKLENQSLLCLLS